MVTPKYIKLSTYIHIFIEILQSFTNGKDLKSVAVLDVAISSRVGIRIANDKKNWVYSKKRMNNKELTDQKDFLPKRNSLCSATSKTS